MFLNLKNTIRKIYIIFDDINTVSYIIIVSIFVYFILKGMEQ